MRRELANECRKLFRRMMKADFPDFQEDKGQVHPQGWYVWTHLHHSRDMLTMEAAWDFDGKLPPYHGPDDYSSGPSWLRTSFLWCRNSRGTPQDIWWTLVLRVEEFERAMLYEDDPVEQCLPLVAPAVHEARDKVKQYVLPFFEEVVRKHGQAAQDASKSPVAENGNGSSGQ